MYTENTIIQYGMYKYMRLGQVDAEFLLELYSINRCPNASIKEYIERNLENLNERSLCKTNTSASAAVICMKIQFATKKVAKEALKQIRETGQEHYKPIRTYECDICNAWHLTSLPYDVWKSSIRKAPDLRGAFSTSCA